MFCAKIYRQTLSCLRSKLCFKFVSTVLGVIFGWGGGTYSRTPCTRRQRKFAVPSRRSPDILDVVGRDDSEIRTINESAITEWTILTNILRGPEFIDYSRYIVKERRKSENCDLHSLLNNHYYYYCGIGVHNGLPQVSAMHFKRHFFFIRRCKKRSMQSEREKDM